MGKGSLTFGDGWLSFALNPIWDSRSPWVLAEVGLKNLSKMAMTKNMEMRMAVATNPKDTALTELSNCLQWSSLGTFNNGASTGGQTLQPPCCSTILEVKSQLRRSSLPL